MSMILVHKKNVKPLEAMQFTYENREEFIDWASPRFGVSSQPLYTKDRDGNVTGGFVWLGRRGDATDTRIELGAWVVSDYWGVGSFTPEQFENWYVRV